MLITILVGLVAGIIGKFIMPGKDPGGIIVTALIGIAGAILGRKIGEILEITNTAGKSFDLASMGLSIVGVVILLLIYRLIFKKKK